MSDITAEDIFAQMQSGGVVSRDNSREAILFAMTSCLLSLCPMAQKCSYYRSISIKTCG